MHDGVNLDLAMYSEILQIKLTEKTIREAQLEAALQSALQEVTQLRLQIEALEENDEDAESEVTE